MTIGTPAQINTQQVTGVAQDAGLYSSNMFSTFVADVNGREGRDVRPLRRTRIENVLKIGGTMAGVPTLLCLITPHNIRA